MLEQYAVVKAIERITSFPNRSFSVREFAKFSGLSPAMASKALSYMEKERIVSLKTIGKTYQYRADLQNPLCRQWKILFNVQKITETGVVEEAKKEIEDIFSIVLYGSTAKGTNDEKSDVDLLIISHGKKKAVVGLLSSLGEDANISILSLEQWKRKVGEDKVFYENVVYDCVVLYGEKPVVA